VAGNLLAFAANHKAASTTDLWFWNLMQQLRGEEFISGSLAK
jgi:hypothetical protein